MLCIILFYYSKNQLKLINLLKQVLDGAPEQCKVELFSKRILKELEEFRSYLTGAKPNAKA